MSRQFVIIGLGRLGMAMMDTLLSLGTYAFEGGKTLSLTVGIGSGAFRHPADRPTWSGPSVTAAPASPGPSHENGPLISLKSVRPA